MTTFWIHLAQELRSSLRASPRLLMAYLFPLSFYAMMGLVMTKLNPTFPDVIVPSMAVFCLLSGCLLGLPGPLVEDRLTGVHRGLRVHGVSTFAIVVAPALAAALHGLIASLVIALTASPLFDGRAPDDWGAFALVLIVVSLPIAAIGALIGVVSKSGSMTVLISQAIFLPSMLLGGMMVSPDLLPASLRPISALLPTTYAMQALSSLAFGQESFVHYGLALAVLLSSAAIALALALWLYAWDPQRQERRRHAHPLWALAALLPYAAAALSVATQG